MKYFNIYYNLKGEEFYITIAASTSNEALKEVMKQQTTRDFAYFRYIKTHMMNAAEARIYIKEQKMKKEHTY